MPSPPAFTSNKTCTRDPVAVNVQLANRVDPFAAVRASVEGPGPYAAIRAAVDREPAPLTHFKAALARSRR
jgi:hypothetical protein